MSKNFWDKLCGGEKESAPQKQPKTQEQNPSLSQTVTFGKRRGETAEVVFTHPARGIRQVIVDEGGQIVNFPGVQLTERLMRVLEDGVLPAPVVHYRTEFRLEPDGRVRMLWQIQPDGRYWADEGGFGGTSAPEILLCAYLNAEGRFTGPFRVYRIGMEELYDEE